MIKIKSIKSFKHHSVSKEYLYMKYEMHNIQKIEKPTILPILMELQINVVLKAGLKISCQKSFFHLQFLSYSSTFILALNFIVL